MDPAQPVTEAGVLRMRDFTPVDVALVSSASSDVLIPLITTVPKTAGEVEARAYIERQNDRLPSGGGYAFAIARTNDALPWDTSG